MAGTAELNVVVNLISKVGKNIAPLKRDVTEVAKLLEQLLSTPVAEQGKGFLALFNIKEADSPKKVIESITKTVEQLQLALRNGQGADLLKAFGIDDAAKVEARIKELGDAATNVFSGEARAKFEAAAKRFFDLPLEQFETETAQFKQLVKQLDAAAILTPLEGTAGTVTEQYAQKIRRHREALEAMAQQGKEASGVALRQAQEQSAGEIAAAKRTTAGKKQASEESIALAKKTAEAIIQQQLMAADDAVRIEKTVQTEIDKARTQGVAQWRKNLRQVEVVLTELRANIAAQTSRGLLVDDKAAQQLVQLEAMAAAYGILIRKNVDAVKEGAVQETRIREEKAAAAVKIAEDQSAKELAIVRAEIAQVEKALEDTYKQRMAAQSKLSTTPKGYLSNREEIKAQIKVLKGGIEEKLALLEKLRAQEAQIVAASGAKVTDAVKQTSAAEIKVVQDTATQVVKVEEDKTNALQALAEKWASRKKSTVDDSSAVRLAGENELRALEQQQQRERAVVQATEQEKRKAAETTATAQIKAAEQSAEGRIKAEKQVADATVKAGKDTRVFDTAKTAEAILDIERRLAAEIEQTQINLVRKVDQVGSGRVDAAKEISMMILREEEAAAEKVVATWLEASNRFKQLLSGANLKLNIKITGSGSSELPISEKIKEIQQRFQSILVALNKAKVTISTATTTAQVEQSTAAVKQLGEAFAATNDQAAALNKRISSEQAAKIIAPVDAAKYRKELAAVIPAVEFTQAEIETIFRTGSERIVQIKAEEAAAVARQEQQKVDAAVTVETKRVEAAKNTSRQLESVERAISEARLKYANASANELIEVQNRVSKAIEASRLRDFATSGNQRYKSATTQALEAQLAIAKEYSAKIAAVEAESLKRSAAAVEAQAKQRVTLEEEAYNTLLNVQLGFIERSLAAEKGYNQARVQMAEKEQASVERALVQATNKILELKDQITRSAAGTQLLPPDAVEKAKKTLQQWEGALQAVLSRKHELVIQGKWQASPIVGLNAGLDALRTRLLGLPKSSTFTIQLAGLESAVAEVEQIAAKVLEAQQRLNAARAGQSAATSAAEKRVADQQVASATSALNHWKKVYEQLVKVATEAYLKLEAESADFAAQEQNAATNAARARQEAYTRLAAEGQRINAERVQAEIAAGNEVLAAAEAAVVERLRIEGDAYARMIASRQEHSAAIKALAKAEGEMEKEIAEAVLISTKQIYDADAEAYKAAKKQSAQAAAEFSDVVKQQLGVVIDTSEATIAAEKKKNDEIEASYKELERVKGESAKKAADEQTAWAQREADKEADIAKSTAAMWKQNEADKTKATADEAKTREKWIAEYAEYEKEIERQSVADAKKYAREKADAIKDSLNDSRKAAALAGQAVQEALASGSKGATKGAVAAFNQIKKDIASIAEAYTQVGRAIRDGSKKDADAAAEAVEAAVGRIKAALSGVGKSWDDATAGSSTAALNSAKMWEDRMNSLSYRFTHVGFQLGIFGAAAMEAFKRPVEAAAELAKVIEYTASIAGGGVDKIEALRKAALELGSTTIYSSQQAAEGMRALVQAGLSAEQAIGAVKPVLDFAASGMLALDDAGRIAISTMNQFGLGLADLPRITNNVQAAANKTNAEVKDFGEALKNVGPTAKSVGATLEDTTAALGVLSQAGINASMAGTQLRGIYRRLLEASNESSKAGKIFKQLGLDVIDAAGNFKEFSVILEELRAATADMSETERAAKIYEIFGQRAGGPAMVAFLNAGAGAVDNLKIKIGEAADAAEIARERGDGLWGSIEKLKNAWTALTQTIGGAGSGPLKLLVDVLTSLVNALRTAVELSPELKTLVSGFLAIAAVAGGISLVGAAFSLMMGNMLSVLGVMGPLKRMFDTLMLTMRGVDAATAAQIIKERELAAAKAVSTSATEAQLVANGQLVMSNGTLVASNTTLTASFKALGAAQKAIIVIMAALAAVEVIRMLYEMAMAVKENSTWADRAAVSMEKFKEAAAKPVATKQEFALMTEEEMRAEIQRVAKAKQYWLAVIDELERKIAVRKMWSFGMMPTKGLEKDLKKAQGELQTFLDSEAYLKIKPKVDVTEAAQQAKRESKQLITELDVLFGNKKLGINKFDLSKVLEGVDKTTGALAKIERASAKAGDAIQSNLNSSVDESAAYVEKLQQAYADLGVEISQGTAKELQDTREINEEKLRIVEDYYSAAMQATEDYSATGSDEEKKLAEDRQNAYEETLSALDKMYEDALKKMETYAEQVLQAEKDLAKERVDAYNWYIEQTEVSDKLKSQRQKARESAAKIESLFTIYDQQMADGDLKRAEETMGQIQRLVEEANKAQNDELANAIQNQEKVAKQIEELEAKMAGQRETRLDRAAAKAESYGEREAGALEKITEAEKRLSELQAKRSAAKTDKERERITGQIEAQEKRITALRKQASDYDKKSADARSTGADLTQTEENETRRLETLKGQLETYKNIIAAAGERGRLAEATFKEAQDEERTGRALLDTQRESAKIAEYTKKVYESRIQLHESLLDKARAELAIWAEQANNAKLTKAVVVSINENLGKLSLAEGASEELKKLQEKLKDQNIGVSFTAETKDSRTLQIMDLVENKVIKEIVLPIKAGGQTELIKNTLDGLQDARSKGPVVVMKTDPTTAKALDAMGKIGTLTAKVDAGEITRALTEAEIAAERAKLVVTFSSEMDPETKKQFDALIEKEQTGISIPFKMEGTQETQKTWLTLKDIEALKKYYGDKGIEFSVAINKEGFASVPKDFKAVLASLRADIKTTAEVAGTDFGKKFGSTLSPEAARAMQDFADKMKQGGGALEAAAASSAKQMEKVGDAAKAAGKDQQKAADDASKAQKQAAKEAAAAHQAAASTVEVSWKLAFHNMATASNIEKWQDITPFEEFWRRRFNDVVNSWNWAVDQMSKAAGGLQTAWRTVSDLIAGGWEGLMQRLESASLATVNAIKSGWRSWSTFITGIGESVANFFAGIWDRVYNSAKKLWDALSTFWGTTFWEIINKIDDWARNTPLYQMWEDIKTLAEEFWTWLTEIVTTSAEYINSTFIQPFVEGWASIKTAAQDFYNWLTNLLDGAKNWIDDKLFDPMRDGWKSLTSPLNDFFNKLEGWINKAKQWWDDLIEKAKSLLGMQSKSGGSFGGAGSSGGAGSPTGRWGGLVQFARGMADGGHLPGYGGGDRRLTLLEDGEYVLPKEAVRGIGVDALNSIRAFFTKGFGLPNMTLGIPRMATGGPVSAANNSTIQSLGVYDLNLNVNGKTYPVMGRREIVEAFMETMRREGMTKR